MNKNFYLSISYFLIILVLVGVFYSLKTDDNTKKITKKIFTEIERCHNDENKLGCYMELSKNLVNQYDFRKIIDSIEDLENTSAALSECHELMHYIGRDSYEKTQSVKDLYGRGSSVCHSGFYHGVIEGYFEKEKISLVEIDERKISEKIKTVCGIQQDYSVPRFYGECLHGIGHAMMYITDSNLPKSINLCDALPKVEEREICYGGAFMENSFGINSKDHKSKYLKDEDLLYPCNSLDSKYQKSCYTYQTFYFAEITNWELKETLKKCYIVPENFRENCFTTVGSLEIQKRNTNSQNYEVCDLISEREFREKCVQGVIDGMGGRYVNSPEKMLKFCHDTSIGDKNICYETIGLTTGTWSKNTDVDKNVCSKIREKDYIKICNSGYSKMKMYINNQYPEKTYNI
ncbi:MAG TPA: hypothetical protein VGC58_03015 [Candidatus Paceibacterota bacterium]